MSITKKNRLLAASAIAALILAAGTAVHADVSYVGKGMFTFDAITVGNNTSASKAYLKAPISNPGTTSTGSGYPVTIADSLKVTSSITIGGNLAVVGQISDSDSSTLKVADSLYTTGNFTVAGTISNPASSTVKVADTLYATGNLKFDGSLYDGSTNVTTRINQNRTATNDLNGFATCIAIGPTKMVPYSPTTSSAAGAPGLPAPPSFRDPRRLHAADFFRRLPDRRRCRPRRGRHLPAGPDFPLPPQSSSSPVRRLAAGHQAVLRRDPPKTSTPRRTRDIPSTLTSGTPCRS